MCRPYDSEVTPVQRRDRIDPESLSRRHNRGIHRAEGQVAILGDEFGDADPIAGKDRIGGEVSCCEISEESDLGIGSDPLFDEIGDLGDHELGNDQRPRVRKQERETRVVIAVILINVGVERTRVDEKGYRRASRRKIASIFRAVSRCPLLPALAARSRRRPPPRWDSIASRVTSDTVEPRRAASCRSRASRSSGNFTVVRFMVCQHTCSTGSTSRAVRIPLAVGQNAAGHLHTRNWVEVAGCCMNRFGLLNALHERVAP